MATRIKTKTAAVASTPHHPRERRVPANAATNIPDDSVPTAADRDSEMMMATNIMPAEPMSHTMRVSMAAANEPRLARSSKRAKM